MAIDEHARLAFTARHPYEKRVQAALFLCNAVAYCTRLGITVKCLLRDNSAAFRLRDFRAACLELGIKHSFTRPYRPQVNDKADRFSPHYASGHAAGRTRTPLNERTPWPAGNTITTGIVRTAASKASLPCPPPIRQERIF
ncbi:hypothetical protein VCH24_65140 [Variovorax boronicumulans]|nr:hypothetical protein VCH24_65140 [Variovorax boronicumulans]